MSQKSDGHLALNENSMTAFVQSILENPESKQDVIEQHGCEIFITQIHVFPHYELSVEW